mmetsp:Transcript_130807/g.279831  ORF Transcript_130807/g.279831 Transcript_130807/m.279831 type:complete len:453 (-) Transcript_130807:40-1398(-)
MSPSMDHRSHRSPCCSAAVLLGYIPMARAHQVSLAGATDLVEHGDALEELLVPSVVVTAALLLASLGLAAWFCIPRAPAEKGKGGRLQQGGVQPPERTPAQRAALMWLGALVAVTTLLLLGQLAVGFVVNSLTLIADSAHVGADAVTYGFSFLAEWAKTSAGWRWGRQGAAARVAKRIDALSALFSVLVVAGASAGAAVDAVYRLSAKDAAGAKEAEASNGGGGDRNRILGLALLGFSVASTAANVGLLVLHRLRLAAITAATAATGTSQVPPPPPLPMGPLLESVPVPPGPAPPVPPPPLPASEGRQRRRCDRLPRREKIAWLHKAFHPGCSAESCPLGDGSRDLRLVEEGACGEVPQVPQAADDESNLNVHGALLHVITDVLRGLVILVAGLLLQFRVVEDAAKADAVCSLLVSACVVCGSLALLKGVVGALVPSPRASSAVDATADIAL